MSDSNEPDASEREVVFAANRQLERVSAILGSAFTHDPVLNWLCPEPSVYSGLFRYEAEAHYRHHGHVYINGEGTGAAMWLPPGVSIKAPFHWRGLSAAWGLAAKGGLKTLQRAGRLDAFMSRHHPATPHFYLRSIGAALGSQGRGIGSALIQAGLEACDAQGMPAYLESSNVKNNPLYQRHGFEIIGEASLPEGGPTIWFMQRGPALRNGN